MSETKDHVALLLVDDEVAFLEATAAVLSRRGFVVSTAPDGETALRLIDERHFDVVFLDVKMPGMDGVDVFHHISRRAPHLPVVLLTGHGSIQQAFQTSRDGVFEYLAKPCDMDRLMEVARRAAARSTVAASEAIEPSLAAGERVSLLMVDDESELLESLAAALERRGVQVTTAGSGTEALQQLDRQVFDVVLLDMKMPGVSGVSLLERIKAAQPLTEVIILTGHPCVDTAIAGLREGAAEILMKPQSVDNLMRVIRAAYRRRQARVEEERQRRLEGLLEGKPD